MPTLCFEIILYDGPFGGKSGGVTPAPPRGVALASVLQDLGGAGETRRRCEDVTRRRCEDVTRRRCEYVTRRRCEDVTRRRCEYVTRRRCEDVTRRRCEYVTRRRCEDVTRRRSGDARPERRPGFYNILTSPLDKRRSLMTCRLFLFQSKAKLTIRPNLCVCACACECCVCTL